MAFVALWHLTLEFVEKDSENEIERTNALDVTLWKMAEIKPNTKRDTEKKKQREEASVWRSRENDAE